MSRKIIPTSRWDQRVYRGLVDILKSTGADLNRSPAMRAPVVEFTDTTVWIAETSSHGNDTDPYTEVKVFDSREAAVAYHETQIKALGELAAEDEWLEEANWKKVRDDEHLTEWCNPPESASSDEYQEARYVYARRVMSRFS